MGIPFCVGAAALRTDERGGVVQTVTD